MSATDERRILVALFEALSEPERAREIADEPLVVQVARRHRLTPLLAARCRGTLPAQLGEQCRRDHVMTAARNLLLAAAAEECVSALAAAGVAAAVLKGIAYERTLYDEPAARPAGDIDLLVRERDRRAAFETLDRLGFEPRLAAAGFDEPDYHEVAWRRGNVEVDLHLALAPYVRCSIDYETLWRDARTLPLGSATAFVLAPEHAAVFHALHMAIDHFDVPALYLIDLARLLPEGAMTQRADETARAWRCQRPLSTALALTGAFQPGWRTGQPPLDEGPRAAEVIGRFGGLEPLPRRDQLRRKLSHFDARSDLVRYTLVQGRRKLREIVERRVFGRSARARLGMEKNPGRG